jgi:hypothetical protein
MSDLSASDATARPSPSAARAASTHRPDFHSTGHRDKPDRSLS